jgi:O-antigen ligase
MLFVILMMTHTITDIRKLDGLLWVFVLISLILGLQAYDIPRKAFVKGRLEGIGGPDFAEANYFAAFLAAMLPIIGIQLLRCKKWYGKIVCAISAAFTANAVVLCRSRGGLVGIAAGVFVALLLMPKKHRLKLIVCLVIAVIGGIRVSDPQFIERVATITNTGAQRDASAESRLVLWQAGIQMLKDHPLGVGIGNLFQNIGWYVPQYEDMDVHNTYIRCADELGVQGTFVFAVIILTAYLQLLRTRKKTAGLPEKTVEDFVLLSFGLTISLTVMLVCGLTISMTYTEIIWILMTLPLCLTRTVENSMIDHALANAEACETSAATLSPAVGQGPMGPIPAVDMQTQDPEKSL